MTDLIVPRDMNLRVLFDPDASGFEAARLDGIIDDIEARVTAEHFDVETKDGREACRSTAYKVVRSKTALDEAGKAIVDEIRPKVDAINSRRKRVRDRLDAIRDQVRKPLDEWDRRESERVGKLQADLQQLRDLCTPNAAIGDDKARLERALDHVAGLDLTAERWQEFLDEATELHARALDALREAVSGAEKREAERAELEALRKEKADRDAAERAARATEEEAERERERQAEAEERGLRTAEAEEQRQREEEERRAADKRHRAKVRNEAVIAIKAVMSEYPSPGDIFDAIEAGDVPHVRVTY